MTNLADIRQAFVQLGEMVRPIDIGGPARITLSFAARFAQVHPVGQITPLRRIADRLTLEVRPLTSSFPGCAQLWADCRLLQRDRALQALHRSRESPVHLFSKDCDRQNLHQHL